ncbi:efflux RND transporter periplasmic adaptor subunit [Bradyrhizobium sp.]|uniref:efflux RND transporter periplasmic adaptor subunit n=1 Tax=Bradyrhizobium sp. TaxID=376 RepID=UPI002728A13F|nr:efflux RND transporter periplasmic adaptor subunit [Bradyrhizobium sp.]MDO9296213.1 efflux RND transporter periplasmic adaptor subunit [Bradyrhizobium sp.]
MMASRIICIVAAGAVLTGCGEKVAEPQPARPVLSMVVAPMEATNVAVVGTIQPRYKTDFGFRMLGRLIARPVNVGEAVAKGQALAAVDPFAAELAVRSALAQLSTAQGQLANASGNAERQRILIETGATTKATLDSAEQSNAAAQAAVVQAQSNLTKAREQFSYTKVSADYAGVVTAVGAEVGQVVAPGQIVVTVARPDIREAVIDVADDLASALRIGMPLAVTLQLDPRIRAEGKVREIAPQSDAATRSRRIRITLEAPPESFRLGTTITTLIPGGAARGFRLPATAILTRDGRSSVWLLDPASKSVTSRDVQILPNGDGSVDVTEGIEAGARIVTAGVHHLKEGQKVRLEQEAAR